MNKREYAKANLDWLAAKAEEDGVKASEIDTVAIIALKATRVEACEEERQEEEGDADRIERGAEFAAAVIGKEAHERCHDDADGGM